MPDKNQDRAVRYRRLALAERDKAKAALLYKKSPTKPSEVCCARSTGASAKRFSHLGR